jgi:hypothetical protein
MKLLDCEETMKTPNKGNRGRQTAFKTLASVTALSLSAGVLFASGANAKQPATANWGPDLMNPSGPNASDDFCQNIVTLYRGEANLDVSTPVEYVAHVQALELLRDSLPGGAPQGVADDFTQVIDTFSAARDATAQTGLQAFNSLADPTLAGAEGRIRDYIEAHCEIAYGDPTYAIAPPPRQAPVCPAWPGVASPLTNNRFPYLIDDSAANYFSVFYNHGALALPAGTPGFIDVPLGGKVEYKGDYPITRYFAFHPNDIATNNFDTLRDIEIDPDSGSTNPWRNPVDADDNTSFTAYLDFRNSGFSPAPVPPYAAEANTRFVGYLAKVPVHVAKTLNPAALVLIRNYGSILGALPPNYSGIELPEVNIYDATGTLFKHYPACDPYPAGYEPPVDGTKFPSWQVSDFRSSMSPGRVELAGNFGLPIDLLANQDVFYYQTTFSKLKGNVFVVKAKKPDITIPDLGDPSTVRDDVDAQIRMFTACVYNFWNGVAVDCKTDEEIVTDKDGFYTLVVAEDGDMPENAKENKGYTMVDWGPFIDGGISYRNLFKDTQHNELMREAIDTGVVPPGLDPAYVPVTAHCPTEVFKRGGKKGADECFAWDAANNH